MKKITKEDFNKYNRLIKQDAEQFLFLPKHEEIRVFKATEWVNPQVLRGTLYSWLNDKPYKWAPFQVRIDIHDFEDYSISIDEYQSRFKDQLIYFELDHFGDENPMLVGWLDGDEERKPILMYRTGYIETLEEHLHFLRGEEEWLEDPYANEGM